METPSADTANQYLRFGWKLINQYVVPATDATPAAVHYVLASVRSLEDTKELVALTDPELVNQYLQAGWKLIDKYLTSGSHERREETLHFVLAWQSADDPVHPGTTEVTAKSDEST
jgi:hypothetical protein